MTFQHLSDQDIYELVCNARQPRTEDDAKEQREIYREYIKRVAEGRYEGLYTR